MGIVLLQTDRTGQVSSAFSLKEQDQKQKMDLKLDQYHKQLKGTS